MNAQSERNSKLQTQFHSWVALPYSITHASIKVENIIYSMLPNILKSSLESQLGPASFLLLLG